MRIKYIVIIFFLILSSRCFAQQSSGTYPESFYVPYFDIKDIKTVNIVPPDVESLIYHDMQRAEYYKQSRCGVKIPLHLNFFDVAQKIDINNSSVYVLKIVCPYAHAMNIYSDNFYIPKGGQLYIWNPDKTKCIGAFTFANNTDEGYFATDYVTGDTLILEYYPNESNTSQTKIDIESIGYFYKDIEFTQEYYKSGFNGSDKCEVDVNCSEGKNYATVKRSVTRILMPMNENDLGWCTGTLLNNTNNDFTPYIITAAHCIETLSSKKYYSQFIFYFNYEKSGCSDYSEKQPSYNTLTGASLLSYDISFGNNGSDYLFLQLKDTIPASYNAYWSGWSISESGINKGVCIHHPAGDVKKISTFATALQERSYRRNMWRDSTHWIAKWKKTAHGFGVTEGGSSGCGLFDSKGYYIGTLSGGYSSCETEDDYKYDWFGKFYVTYRDIRSWLNPLKKEISQLNGTEIITGLQNYDKPSSFYTNIYPNPADNIIYIDLPLLYDNITLSLSDINGNIVYNKELYGVSDKITEDISALKSGIYIMTIKTKEFTSSKKLIIR